GVAESGTSPFWVSDNHTGLSTLYNTPGKPQGLVVSIPAPGDPLGASGAPTGIVFNPTLAQATPAFQISGVAADGRTPATAPAIFIWDTEDGTILGWNPGVFPPGSPPSVPPSTHAIIAVDHSAIPDADNHAIYKGLAVATDATGHTLLYATNFRAGTV